MNRNDPYDPHQCARRGDIHFLQQVLQRRASAANQQEANTGMTPLHYAVEGQNHDCVELLLRCGADPNIPDAKGQHPIHLAAKHVTGTMGAGAEGSRDPASQLVEMLLQYNADPTSKTHTGDTVLHLAARDGNKNLLELVWGVVRDRDIDMDVDEITKRDETPLFCAAAQSHKSAVLYLLSLDANPHIPNNKGKTPFDLAMRWAKSEEKKKIEGYAKKHDKPLTEIMPYSGDTYRKCLIPDYFNDVRKNIGELKRKPLSPERQPDGTEAPPSIRRGPPPGADAALPDAVLSPASGGAEGEHNCSFEAQLGAMARSSARDRLARVGQLPRDRPLNYEEERALSAYEHRKKIVNRPPHPDMPPHKLTRRASQMSLISSRGHTSDRDSGTDRGTSRDGRETSQGRETSVTGTEDTRRRDKHERARHNKERGRVDDRLRGLFYADLRATQKQQQKERREQARKAGAQAGDRTLARLREQALASQAPDDASGQLLADIRALKEAGFKDPNKEERKRWRKVQRAKRRTIREAKREAGADGGESDDDNDDAVGEICREHLLVESGGQWKLRPEAEVVPGREGAFSLRAVARCDGGDDRGGSGIFHMIDELEERLHAMHGTQGGIEKLCVDLTARHRVLQTELKHTTRRGASPARHLPASPRSPPGGGAGAPASPFHAALAALPRKEQQALEAIEERIKVLEKRAKRSRRRARDEESSRRESSILFWWLVRLALVAAVAGMVWLRGECAFLLPPPVWAG